MSDEDKTEVKRLREALEQIKERGDQGGYLCDCSHGMWRIAQEALSDGNGCKRP